MRRIFSTMAVGFLLATALPAGVQAYENFDDYKCYSHWNGEAWEGHGMAIVFCKDAEPMVDCNLVASNGAVVEFAPHIANDHGRKVWTVYSPNAYAYPGYGKMVCTGQNGESYTIHLNPTTSLFFGGCNKLNPYGGEACTTEPEPEPPVNVPPNSLLLKSTTQQ